MSAGETQNGAVQDAPQINEGANEEVKENSTNDSKDELKYEGEGPRETVARVLRESRKNSGRSDEESKPKPVESRTQDGAKSEGTVKQSESKTPEKPEKTPEKSSDSTEEKTNDNSDESLSPPERFSAKGKTAFKKAPPELQRELVKMVKDTEAALTKGTQESRQAQREANHIIEAVRPYLLNDEYLMKNGYTESRFVAELVGAHKRLANPKTATEEWLRVGQQIGMEKDLIDAIRDELSEDSDGGIANSQVSSLQQELSAVKSELAQLKSGGANTGQQTTQQTPPNQQPNVNNDVVAELHKVRDEVDDAGEYIYPELHDNSFVKAVEPLFIALLRSVPGISYADALKRAYEAKTGKSPKQTQNRLPSQEITDKKVIRNPNSPVRGRTSVPQIFESLKDIPQEALSNPRETVRYVLNKRKGM